jgi:hypothetical protein
MQTEYKISNAEVNSVCDQMKISINDRVKLMENKEF